MKSGLNGYKIRKKVIYLENKIRKNVSKMVVQYVEGTLTSSQDQMGSTTKLQNYQPEYPSTD